MDFQHQQAAHCESGVISSLLTHRGLPLSEPMVFGLASALAFAYIPIVKLAGQPLIAYRLPPRSIIKGVCKRLGVEVRFRKFSNPLQGAEALDEAVNAGRMVGLQTSVYYLPYFPEEMRFHFNAHNLLVCGKQGDDYLISDPIFEEPVSVASRHLNKARFARGALAPKGLMYEIDGIPAAIDWQKVIPAAVAKNCRIMLGAPLPIIGIKGIRYLSKKIANFRGDARQLRLFLGHIVRMQEEIGTGGAGFRFIYASFLEEAAKKLNDEKLREASDRMTAVGDEWRAFALAVVQQCKKAENIDQVSLAQHLLVCAEKEAAVWRELKVWAAGAGK